MEINSNSIFLLGAGFTKAAYPSAPLNKNLLKTIIDSGGKTLAKYKKSYHTDDIERLLTLVDLDAFDSDEIRNDRSLIDAEISSYFSQYRFSSYSGKIPTWLTIFGKTILKNNDSIVSLNYDCFLEGALDHFEVWTPNGGYAGVNNPLSSFQPAAILANPKNIKIFKIHGSENFVEAKVDRGKRSQTAINFFINESIYPVSGVSLHLGGGGTKRYIIAPSFVKIPHVDISAMMLDLLKVAEVTRNLVIIGCGMRSEDNFLWLLLTCFLNKIMNHRHRLVILSPSSESIWKRISKYWVGDICRFSDVSIIPRGLEDGISTLESNLKD